MLTLDPTLQAAQDGVDRHPIVSILSNQFAAAIPFDGQYLNDSSPAELEPSILATTGGRIVGVLARGDDMVYLASDDGLTEFSETAINTTYPVRSTAIVELATGNIGVIWIESPSGSGSYYIKIMTVTPAGAVVVAKADIASYAKSTYRIDDVDVIRLADGSFLLIYAHENIGTGVYSLMMRTSADFASWSAEAAISVAGLVDAQRKANPDLIQVAGGDILLHFDYVDDIRPDGSEIVNIYHAVSGDNGATFSAPAAITANAVYGASSKNPDVVEMSGGTITLTWHDEVNVLHMDFDSDGYCMSMSGFCSDSLVTDLHFDPATRLLYLYNIYTDIGNKVVCSIVVVDVDDWTVEKCYSSVSSPAFSTLFNNLHCWPHRNSGDGKYAAVGTCKNSNQAHVLVINHESETITEYHFWDNETYSVLKNIDVDWRGKTYVYLQATAVHAASDRLYCYFIDGGYKTHWFGYIDLTLAPDAVTGKYAWNEIFYESPAFAETVGASFASMLIVPELDYAVFGYATEVSSWKGALRIYSLSSGALVKDYNFVDYSAFPWRGVSSPAYYNGKLYCSFPYESGYDQADRRGLLVIDIATDTMTYVTPTFAAGIDSFGLGMKTSLGDGRIAMVTASYGVQVYDSTFGTWTGYDNAALPGFTPDESDSMSGGDIEYDPANKTIFASRASDGAAWNGVLAFSELGAFKQVQYCTGTFTTQWAFDDAAPLVQGNMDSDGAVAVTTGDVIWAFWTRQDLTEYSIKWDKSDPVLDVSGYIVGVVEAQWSVGDPNRLSFTCSHGHLFDPNNLLSMLSRYFKRGRIIELKFGEHVAGVDYWQPQGKFVVTGTAISYAKGEYPVINVQAEDRTAMWREGVITATEYYDDAHPEQIFKDLVEAHAGLTSSDYDLPADGAMTASHKIYHQWIETNLMDMIKALADHFNYVPFMDVNGKFTLLEVNMAKSVDHVYSDQTQLMKFTPDDSFSNYTNRVVVKGEGRYFLEVLYAEEVVGSLAGTIGWWGCTETKRVYYSEDRVRQCRSPRMEVVEPVSVNGIFNIKGGGSQWISDEDLTGETWVDVTIQAPNLVAAMLAALTAIAATGYSAIGCVTSCGWRIYLLALETQIAGYILGAMANYSYNIWARPVGHEKQTFQAQADDTQMQSDLAGFIVTEEMDDPFCYETAECLRVAQNELAVVSAQRKRIKFDKIAHLQDEILDMIQIRHPYSGLTHNILITSLNRTYEKPSGTSGDGGVIDHIEGWRIV